MEYEEMPVKATHYLAKSKKAEVIKMNYARLAKLRKRVLSNPQGSREREQAFLALSEADRHDVYQLELDIMTGRIKESEINMQEEDTMSMSYEAFKGKMGKDYKGKMAEISKFAKESPELYQSYKERYSREQMEQARLRNMRLTENTHKNKPYSFK